MGGRRLPYTPSSMIVAMLRRLWMWSRERRIALRRSKVCECCGGPGPVEVHHKKPASLPSIVALIREELLVSPDKLQVLCIDCHDEVHGKERGAGGNPPAPPE